MANEPTTYYAPSDMEKTVGAANYVFDHLVQHDLFRQELQEKNRLGVFAVRAHKNGLMRHGFFIGTVLDEKQKKYFELAQEKCQRLAAHESHFSSRQSENEAMEQYRGAVRGTNSLWGASGLPGDLDELFDVLWSLQMNDMNPGRARAILEPNERAMKYLLAPNGFMK